LSYFAVLQNQFLANLGLTLTQLIVVAILYFTREPQAFNEYFRISGREREILGSLPCKKGIK
jgi:hypothetical protein